jgi:hypothetical protein
LADHVADLREKEAITLLVFPEQLEKLTTDLLPEGMFAGIAPSADEIREFLGGGALSGQLLSRRGIFVTDRYGEIAGLWIVREHDFPGIDQVLGALDSVEIACEECGVPIWPVDE